MKTMNVQLIPIKSLKLLEHNPRTITKSQFEKLCTNIKLDPDFFSMRPILVNKTEEGMIVYAGNQRLRAAESLKMDVVPCVIEENLSLDIMKNRLILDNITHGEFDFDLLANQYEMDELLELGMLKRDLDIFDITEIDVGEEEEKKHDHEKCPECGKKLKKSK